MVQHSIEPANRPRRHPELLAERLRNTHRSRIPVDIPVTWRTPGATDVTRSRLVEISIGGALLESTDKHELGTDILVEAQLPGAVTPVEIASKVAYHAPRGMGLKFIYRDGGGSRRIRELVRRLRAE